MRIGGAGSAPARELWERGAALAFLAAASAYLFLTSATAGDFWWYDASGHAMNGLFIHDLIKAAPFKNPAGWAIAYYLQHPAVTVLFYPPLFPAVEAVLFLLLGPSHAVAQLTVALFAFALALGVYRLARRASSPAASAAAGLLALGMPMAAFWGRQVMLEIPALALAVWSVYFAVDYAGRRRTWSLILAVILFCMSVYTKQTFIFLGPVVLLMLLMSCGWSLLARRELWIAGLVGLVLAVPLAVITLKFGQFNATLASGGGAHGDPAVLSWSSASWYARRLGALAGWPQLLLGAAGLALGWRRRDPQFLALVGWLAIGYVFNSLVALKDDRYGLHFMLPLAIFAAVPLDRLRAAGAPWGALLAAGAAVFLFTAISVAAPRVGGFQEAAERIAAVAPKDGVVAFVGHRSGAFVFDLTLLRPDLTVLRPEKLLVSFRQSHDYVDGVTDVGTTQIEDLIARNQVTYAVIQNPAFWSDLPSMATLGQVLQSNFDIVAEIPTPSNMPHEEQSLLVLKNRNPVAAERAPLTLDMPLIGQKFSR